MRMSGTEATGEGFAAGTEADWLGASDALGETVTGTCGTGAGAEVLETGIAGAIV